MPSTERGEEKSDLSSLNQKFKLIVKFSSEIYFIWTIILKNIFFQIICQKFKDLEISHENPDF